MATVANWRREEPGKIELRVIQVRGKYGDLKRVIIRWNSSTFRQVFNCSDIQLPHRLAIVIGRSLASRRIFFRPLQLMLLHFAN